MLEWIWLLYEYYYLTGMLPLVPAPRDSLGVYQSIIFNNIIILNISISINVNININIIINNNNNNNKTNIIRRDWQPRYVPNSY